MSPTPPSSKSYTKTYTDVSIGNVEIPQLWHCFRRSFLLMSEQYGNLLQYIHLFVSLWSHNVVLEKKKSFWRAQKENVYVYVYL